MSKYLVVLICFLNAIIFGGEPKDPPSLTIAINGAPQGGIVVLNWTSQPDKGGVTIQTSNGQSANDVAVLLVNAINAKSDFYKAGTVPYARNADNLVIVNATSPGDFFMTSTDPGLIVPLKLNNVRFETLDNPLRIKISWDAPPNGSVEHISIQCGWSLLAKIPGNQTSFEHNIQNPRPTLLTYSLVAHKNRTPGDKVVETITNPKE